MAKTEPPAQVEVERARGSWFSVRWMAPLTAAGIAIVVWALVQTPAERRPQIASAPSPPVDAATPATPPPPAERDATAQARAGTAEVEQKRAHNDARQQAAAKAPGRDEERGKRENQERPAPADAPAAARDSAGAMLRAVRTPTVIASPNPNVRWRFAGFVVERSTDAGVTWSPQVTGSQAVLVAGASPAPTVCWIVGQAGTVLLTTDGVTWIRLDVPDPKADLVAITARDGLSATVTASDGRTYRTDDGGKTWRVQENPVAAF